MWNTKLLPEELSLFFDNECYKFYAHATERSKQPVSEAVENH